MPSRIGLPLMLRLIIVAAVAVCLVSLADLTVQARPEYRDAFYAVYPGAVGTAIETVSSQPNHCGVCHYSFTGILMRNPYGVKVHEALNFFSDTPLGRRSAIISIENEDPDLDGFSTLTEVTDTVTYPNTPTFPGLTPDNVGDTIFVTESQIDDHLVPTTGGDSTPPSVTVISPNGGETVTGNAPVTVQWSISDASAIHTVEIHLSLNNGSSYDPMMKGLSDTGSVTWYPPNEPTTQARLRVVATDTAFNTGQDNSNATFTIVSAGGGVVPSTLRDFHQPGSQPFDTGTLFHPDDCSGCHGDYDNAVEPHFNWSGSMKAHASRDPLFRAAMAVSNQYVPDSGDLCLRCHTSRGWMAGRSVPTDGSRLETDDLTGMFCGQCHRMVDPIYTGGNPSVDPSIIATLDDAPTGFGNGMYVLDPDGEHRRGPFDDADRAHPIHASPFHEEAALCGTCHDVSNPVFENDGSGNFLPNGFDSPTTDFGKGNLMPLERTYSEWLNSDYNSPGGVYAPQFGGNLSNVSTCQDCHMRDVTGIGGTVRGSPPITRDDLPLHDFTGGSTWLPGLLEDLYPDEVDDTAMQAGILRARYMLQNAATVSAVQNGVLLEVTVTNETGHKLPTGYPEGRRLWLNVRFYDGGPTLLSESGAYDPITGVLTEDAEIKVYEAQLGVDETVAPLVGQAPGPSHHFALNNKVFKDNRIPPRGFTNTDFQSFGGAPVAYSYADGQYWDITSYAIPQEAVSAEVTLYYQSTSREFVEFLRDENTTDSSGQEMYDLWNDNGKCPPEVVWSGTVPVATVPVTIWADLICMPQSGTLPFAFYMGVNLENQAPSPRRAAARIDVIIAGGSSISNWRSGYTNLSAGEFFSSGWMQSLPGLGTLVGENQFSLDALDVTPPPYNQPPYAAAGDMATDVCTVTASAP